MDSSSGRGGRIKKQSRRNDPPDKNGDDTSKNQRPESKTGGTPKKVQGEKKKATEPVKEQDPIGEEVYDVGSTIDFTFDKPVSGSDQLGLFND